MAKKRTYYILFFIILFIVIVKYSGLFDFISLKSIQKHVDIFSLFVDKHYVLSVLCFLLAYAVTIMIAIPGFAPLTLVGGYLFGTIHGALYALAGSFLGSSIAYFGVRFYLKTYVLTHYDQTIKKFSHYVHEYGMSSTLLLLHFLTVIPFFLINAFAAVTGVTAMTFVWTTIVGSLPLVFIYAYAGQKLHQIETVADIFSPTVMMLFGILIAIALLPMIVRKIFRYITGKKELC